MASATFPVAQGGNGLSYSADGSAAQDMLNGGHRTHYVTTLQQTIIMAQSAAASAAAASAGAANLTGTSTTSVAVGTGSKSFTASTAKSWVAGGWVIVFRTSSVSNYMLGRVTSYNSGTGALVVDVTGTNGSGTYTDWTITVAGPQGATGSVASVGEATLSSNTTLGTGDRGKVIRCTSTFTLTFTACATLTAGWWAYVANEGTGSITLDPNSSEQIDGLATFVMYPGESRLVWVNAGATALESLVLTPFSVTYTSGVNTFTKPPGYTSFGRYVVAGGASGGKSGSTSFGVGGGGGGAGIEEITLASTYGTTETCTVGAGGVAVSSVGAGNAGNSSSVGSLRVVYGGGAGSGNGSANHSGGGGGGLGGAGGSGSTSNGTGGLSIGGVTSEVLTGGGSTSSGVNLHGGGVGGGTSANSGHSVYGGGGGGGRGSGGGTDRPAGASVRAGAGGASGTTGDGTAGTAPGGGGGATQTGTNTGAGAAGRITIWGVV